MTPELPLPVLIIVSMFAWMTPMPQHSEGLLVTYGSQQLVEANAAYRGYDLSYYKNRCGISAISPADLGKVVWVRVYAQGWFGPCLTVDTAAQKDFHRIVYRNQEIAEVPVWMSSMFYFEHGRWGEVFLGLCPPDAHSKYSMYRPPLYREFEGPRYEGPNPRARSPKQQMPLDCYVTSQVEGN